MNHDVFISYSSKNIKEATTIYQELKNNGIKCWMAPQDIPGGTNYLSIIPQVIAHSKVVVLIFSNFSAHSDYVINEINIAFNSKKTIIPYKISNDTYQQYPEFNIMLTNRHWIESYPDYKTHLNDLIKAVSCNIDLTTTNSKNIDIHTTKNKNKKSLLFTVVALIIIIIFIFSFIKGCTNTNSNPKIEQNIQHHASEALNINTLNDKEIIPYLENGKYGYKQKDDNKILITAIYENAENFREGYACVKLNNKYGVIDKNGNEVIPFKYEKLRSFHDGIALAQIDGKYGFIDKTGLEVIPIKYDFAGGFGEGIAVVKLNNKFGYVDKKGTEIISLKYENAKGFCEGLASVKLNGKYGYIDKNNNIIIPFKYTEANGFHKGKAKVKLNNESFFINKRGERIQ